MLLSALLTAALLAVPADSLTGTWQVTGDVAGTPLNEICTLKQTGTAITGSCKAATPADARAWAVTGDVQGSTVTFSHDGDYEGTPLTIVFTATLGSPPQLKGGVEVAPFGAGGTFSATPAPVAPAPVAAPAKP